jgi:hypothetical protein
MNLNDLQSQVALGEDSRCQFKRNVTHIDSLAAEMAAFANSEGGLNDSDGWFRLLILSALR